MSRCRGGTVALATQTSQLSHVYTRAHRGATIAAVAFVVRALQWVVDVVRKHHHESKSKRSQASSSVTVATIGGLYVARVYVWNCNLFNYSEIKAL